MPGMSLTCSLALFFKLTQAGQPMTIRDFMNYLIYVEHAAENLQFFLWYKDYVKRFQGAKPADKSLAPEWTQGMQDDTVARIRKDRADKLRAGAPGNAIFKGSDFEKEPHELGRPKLSLSSSHGSNPFGTPPRTPASAADKQSIDSPSTALPSIDASTYKSQAADAFHAAGAKQPCKCDGTLECLHVSLTRSQSLFSPSVTRSTGSSQHISWMADHDN